MSFSNSKDESNQDTLLNVDNEPLTPPSNELIAPGSEKIDKTNEFAEVAVAEAEEESSQSQNETRPTTQAKTAATSISILRKRSPQLSDTALSTTPCSSTHSTSSTGITVLERSTYTSVTSTTASRQDLVDQDLSLDEFDVCVDEANDGDDEFDESLNLDENCCMEDEFNSIKDKTPVPQSVSHDEMSLSEKTTTGDFIEQHLGDEFVRHSNLDRDQLQYTQGEADFSQS